MALFKQALDAKSENSHTYSNALNANIRCGNLSGAEEVLEIMKKRGRKRDVIICTTLLKGYCSAGRINKAQAFFDDMVQRAPTVTPNLRTINTLLRGCVQTGDVAIAESLVARAQKDFKIALDVSSWEYLVTLLCQSLKLDKVLPIVGRLKDDAACASGMAGMYVNMARTAAVLGDWKVCRKALTGAAASLDSVASTDANEDQNDREDDEAAVTATATATAGTKGDKGTGGKRGSSSAETDARRQESLEVYREHLKSELGAELKVIEAFMTARKDSKVSAFEYVFPFFLRIFPLFPPEQLADGTAPASATTAAPAQTAPSGRPGKKDGGSSNSNSLLKKELVKPIMRAVEDNFGLDVLSRRVTGRSCDDLCGYSLDPSKAPEALAAAAAKAAEAKAAAKAKKLKRDKKRGKAVGGEPAASTASAPAASAVTPDSVPAPVPAAEREKPVLTPLEAQIASFRAHSARVFDSSCKFVFKNVFSTPATTTITSAPASAAAASGSRDLKVEICSGAGEWVVAQAKQDPAADWVAVELRHDRAYQTLTKAVFADVRNLAVLCGDAMHILPSHFPSDCVSRLFVNHPEPPQQTGSRGDSQGRHLLEQVRCMPVLSPPPTVHVAHLYLLLFCVCVGILRGGVPHSKTRRSADHRDGQLVVRAAAAAARRGPPFVCLQRGPHRRWQDHVRPADRPRSLLLSQGGRGRAGERVGGEGERGRGGSVRGQARGRRGPCRRGLLLLRQVGAKTSIITAHTPSQCLCFAAGPVPYTGCGSATTWWSGTSWYCARAPAVTVIARPLRPLPSTRRDPPPAWRSTCCPRAPSRRRTLESSLSEVYSCDLF